MNIVEHIQQKNATGAAASITQLLNIKVLNALTEARKQVAVDLFGEAEDVDQLSEAKQHTFHDIEHGDIVKYKTPQKQIASGTAHIHGGEAGNHWVLRTATGLTPVVNPKNFHSVSKRNKPLSSSKHFLVYGGSERKRVK